MEVFLSIIVGICIGIELCSLATVLHDDYREGSEDDE